MAEAFARQDVGEIEERRMMFALLKNGLIAFVLAGVYILPLIYLCHRKRINLIDKCLAGVVVLIPAVLFFVAISLITSNVPFWDDYDAIMRYVCHPTMERMMHLFNLHNQHRIVTIRLFLEGMVALTGKVDFKVWHVTVEISLLITGYILYSRYLSY